MKTIWKFLYEFDTTYTTVIDTIKWSRTPWMQGGTNKITKNGCGPDTVFLDRAYIIKDDTDTTTIKVNGGICKLLTTVIDHTKHNYYGDNPTNL